MASSITIPGGGGNGDGGTPGGADTQVQFNDGGAFGGDAGLTYNKTTDLLTSPVGMNIGEVDQNAGLHIRGTGRADAWASDVLLSLIPDNGDNTPALAMRAANSPTMLTLKSAANGQVVFTTTGVGALIYFASPIAATMNTPASATAAGVKDTFCYDTGFLYICTANNVWKRVAIATW